jgi:hypothetical protein
MPLALAQHIVPRISSVLSVRDNKNDIVGWEYRCWTCRSSSIYMTHEREKAVSQIAWHQCRQSQPVKTERIKNHA